MRVKVVVEFEADFDDAREVLYENALNFINDKRASVLRSIELGADFAVYSADNREIGTITVTPLDATPEDK